MALAPEKFRRLSTVEDTLNDIIRKLNYIFAYLELGTSVNISDKSIKSNHIDFGINSEQVKASNIPIIDSALQYVDDDVEGALAEVMNKLNSHKLSAHEGDKIRDINGNELVNFTSTASAVNEVTITNNSTSNGPIIEATGDDINIDLRLKPKGTGAVKVEGDMIHGIAGTEKLGFFGVTAVTKTSILDPADFSVLDGDIGNLIISDPPTQIEVQALRDKCEMLADDCRTLRNKVKELIDVLQGYGLI